MNSAQNRRPRPLGVTAVALAFFAYTIPPAALAYTFTRGMLRDSHGMTVLEQLAAFALWVLMPFALFAGVPVVIGVGLLRLRTWARKIAIAFSIVVLFPLAVGAAVSSGQQLPVRHLLAIIFHAAAAVYLMRKSVKDVFDGNRTITTGHRPA